jgi:leucyl/phenylalanyl-tRNA--protein transferase
LVIDPQTLIDAYCNGYFPMAESTSNEIYWYSPDPRTIFFFFFFHIPKSLQQKIKSNHFQFKINSDFEQVITKCSERKETWISRDIIDSYINLNTLGFAYSFEAYHNNKLAGGLYGVAIRGAFFGESMYHEVRDASKATLVFLVETLNRCGYTLLDTQYITEHLKKFGAIEIPRSEYMKKLEASLQIFPDLFL